MNLYSTFDRLSERFNFPFPAETDAAADRAVRISQQYKGLGPQAFAQEYGLYHVGEFDELTGQIRPLEAERPRPIDMATMAKRRER